MWKEAKVVHREDHSTGDLIFGKHYIRHCGISFPYAPSHSSRLAILAQGRDP